MSHSEVYKWFELYFPQYAGDKVENLVPEWKEQYSYSSEEPSGIYIYIQQ